MQQGCRECGIEGPSSNFGHQGVFFFGYFHLGGPFFTKIITSGGVFLRNFHLGGGVFEFFSAKGGVFFGYFHLGGPFFPNSLEN